MKIEIEIHYVHDKLPESNWCKHNTRYSNYCLVWNGFEQPSFAYYDRETGMWYSEDEPKSENWIDDVQYWAEIPDFNTFEKLLAFTPHSLI